MVSANFSTSAFLDFFLATSAYPISTLFATTATDAISGSVSFGVACACAFVKMSAEHAMDAVVAAIRIMMFFFIFWFGFIVRVGGQKKGYNWLVVTFYHSMYSITM